MSTLSMVARYISLGALGVGLNLSIVALLVEVVGLPPAVAGLFGFFSVFLFGFIVARKIIFRSKTCARRQMVRYSAVNLMARGCEYIGFVGLIAFIKLDYAFSIIIVLLVSNFLKFSFYRHWVFPSGEEEGA